MATTPEHGAVAPKHIGVTNIVTIYARMTCIMLDNKDSLVKIHSANLGRDHLHDEDVDGRVLN